MDFFELINTRESCRNYKPDPVERAKLEQLIEAARLAPSACNSQPWSFTVVTGSRCAQLAPCLQELGMNKFASQAPAFIVVTEEKASLAATVASRMKSQEYAQMDVGIATAHLCLAATQLGLGTCIMGWFNEEKVKALLDIPQQKRVRLVVSVGYGADGAPRPKKRKETQQICRFFED